MSPYTIIKIRAEPTNGKEWWALSKNPSPVAIALLAANPAKIMASYLSKNPAAIALLAANRDRICWYSLCLNQSPDAPALLSTGYEYINWNVLSNNRSSAAIEYLSSPENFIHINWWILSENNSPAAIKLLMENPDKIVWWHAFQNRDVSLFALIEAAIRVPGYRKDGWIQMSPTHPSRNFREEYDRPLTLYDSGWAVVSQDPRPEAVALLMAYPEMINYDSLSLNPAPEALKILTENPDKINWVLFSKNSHPDAVALLLKNQNKIDVNYLAKNTHPDAIKLLIESIYVDVYGQLRQSVPIWYAYIFAESSIPEVLALLLIPEIRERIGGFVDRILSENESPAAGAFLTKHPEYIHWQTFSANKSAAAAEILEANPQNISWDILAYNTGVEAAALFARNVASGARIPKKEQWLRFEHPAIFEEKYDYAAMRVAMDVHREALAKAAFHPRRLELYLAAGGDPDDF